MNLEDSKQIKINDYLYYKSEGYFFVGFVTEEIEKHFGDEYFIKIYSELSISKSEWDLDESWIPIEDIYQKLELKTLIQQLQERYSSILI